MRARESVCIARRLSRGCRMSATNTATSSATLLSAAAAGIAAA